MTEEQKQEGIIGEVVEKKEEDFIRKPTEEDRIREKLKSWVPKTKVGKLVKEGKIKEIDEILKEHKILEAEIVDSLLHLKSDLLNIGQSKGKFGGGKRRVWRQTQKIGRASCRERV